MSERISAAGNTEAPAVLVLSQAGFEVSTNASHDDEQWIATRHDLTLVAASPLELLGLFMMRKERGLAWKASDDEIEDFLKKFNP
jgi:hypothetical protein